LGLPRRLYSMHLPNGAVSVARSESRVPSRRRALEDLYAAHIAEAVQLGYVVTGSREAGEDIAQEAFVRVASRIALLRDGSRFESYLKKTIVNLARSSRRRFQREITYVRRERSSAVSVQEPHDVGARDVWDELLGLPPRQRAALFLRYHNDLSYEQIADTLDCSTGAAKALCARALKSLRSNWGEGHE
jgi:RNA polymerase sigma factor (sigma-70 family)